MIIAAFLLLAWGSYGLDAGRVAWLAQLRETLQVHVFSDAKSTSDLLSTIASGLIAMTSFSFGLLLLAVQQTAASMTSYVVDQFLRRRINQFYFGFFAGLALYSLLVLATVGVRHNPIYGAGLALLLTVVALCLLLLLLYTTINQIRPVVVVDALHDHILLARANQLAFLRRTRRASASHAPLNRVVRSTHGGYVVAIDLDVLGAPMTTAVGEVEVVWLVSIGSFVAFEDPIAEVKANTQQRLEALSQAVLKSLRLERQQALESDPGYGIEQLLTIAWTSVSTSKSNPAPGLLTIRSLRDLLARWASDPEQCGAQNSSAPEALPLPVVYADNVLSQLMDAFETLAVVSTESMQHQNFAEVLHVFTALFERLPPQLARRAEDLILRILSGLGDHVLTAELDGALSSLAAVLDKAGSGSTAAALSKAQQELRVSIGQLNSRATRVPATPAGMTEPRASSPHP